ncbi:MAG: hypothetical protein LBM77_13510 [Spirochaetaceae bacterium]|nr:hypothetical protein [Spirochaetaceae bacterium]
MDDDIYEFIPKIENEIFELRLIKQEDADNLILVYNDPKNQEILNDCSGFNCDFGYEIKTSDDMRKCIKAWLDAYKLHTFVRLSIIDKSDQNIIGTIEVFKKSSTDEFCPSALVLRIDMLYKYENEMYIKSLLSLIIDKIVTIFSATGIVTRATPIAEKRIMALKENGFSLSNYSFKDQHGRNETYADFWVFNID